MDVRVDRAPGAITNFGLLSSTGGVSLYLYDGGSVTNGSSAVTTARISAFSYGVYASRQSTTVTNFGAIYSETAAAVLLRAGGSVTNGSAADTTASLIGETGVGLAGAPATLTNFGTIQGTSYGGVYLNNGGALINGSASDTAALIEAYSNGIAAASAATMVNYGTISSAANFAVYLGGGGSLANGSSSDTTALIAGVVGVGFYGPAPATVTNFGTVSGSGGTAVEFTSAADRLVVDESAAFVGSIVGGGGALELAGGADAIYGLGGVPVLTQAAGSTDFSGFGAYIVDAGASLSLTGIDATLTPGKTLTNDGQVSVATVLFNRGVISGSATSGVTLDAGASVVNGSGGYPSALILGNDRGVYATAGSATAINYGIIEGAAGVNFYAGGSVTNGSAGTPTGQIDGVLVGVAIQGAAATIGNFATIQSVDGPGAYLSAGGTVTNGSAADTTALIAGARGVYARGGAATLVNFGTISGTGGTAVQLGASSDVLVAQAGGVFNGAVQGDGATLDLASGTGTIASLAAGNVTVSGSMPTTTFTNFGTVEVAAGAAITLTSPGTIGAGGTQTLGDLGLLSVTDGLTVDGGAITGATSGAGTLALTGGTTSFSAGSTLDVANITVSGAGTVAAFNAPELFVAGLWSQSAGTLTVGAGDRVGFVGSGTSTFVGTFSGAGQVDFGGGSDVLDGAASPFVNRAIVAVSNHTVLTLEGAIANSGAIDLNGLSANAVELVAAGGGVTLTGAGRVVLAHSIFNIIEGATSNSTLTNVDENISGQGFLGGGILDLVNETAGVINANAAGALVIDTGTNTIVNAGLIGASGAGGATIASAIDNTGQLKAVGASTLTVNGAVTGSGIAVIVSATMVFNSSFDQNVYFNGPTGGLKLAQSQAYGGTVFGFSNTGGTQLDLADIAFAGSTASYAGNARRGVLTVKSGAETTTVKLIGDYLNTTFTLAGDGHGGTTVTDTAAPPVHAPAHAFIAAMAGLGGHGGSGAHPAIQSWRRPPILLATPRLHLA